MGLSIALDAAQRAFRREVGDFFQSITRPEWLALDPHQEAFREVGREVDRLLIDKGWYTLHWPKAYGGQGDYVRYTILRELEGYFRVPSHGGHGRHIAGPALIEFGTDAQKQRYLPAIARGDCTVALGYTEANAGSDLAAMTTRATLDGDHYVIDGAKLYITYGHYANTFLLAVRTNPAAPRHKGVSLFLIDMALPGVVQRPMECVTGHSVSEIQLNQVRVPRDCILGELDKGFYHMTVALNYERSDIEYPARYMAQLEDVADYCRSAGLWDEPSTRALVGELAADLQAWRAVCYRVAVMQMQGRAPSWEGSMAQLYRKDFNPKFGRALMEIFGESALLVRGEPAAPLQGRVEAYIRESFNNHGQGGRFVTRNVIARRGLQLPEDRTA